MLNAIFEILSPSFLLRDALYSSLIVGAVCPLIGVYLVLRRMVFVAVALPQVSAAGIAFAFLVFGFFAPGHQHGAQGERVLALSGSLSFTIFALFALAAFEGRQGNSTESRVGVTYALAAALTFLFLAADPLGESQMVNLLKGDMLAANSTSLLTIALVSIFAGGTIWFFRRPLMVVSFDRDLAKTFRMNVTWWDRLLFLCIGSIIAAGVMSAGPLVVFGFLVVPPLTARTLTRRTNSFSAAASLLGVICAFVGFLLSYVLDVPLGPAEVASACALFLLLKLAGSFRLSFAK